MSQLPLSVRGAVPALRESTRTVPAETTGNDNERTPADIADYYQSSRPGLQAYRYPRGVGTEAEYPHWLEIKIHTNNDNPLNGMLGGTSGAFVPSETKYGAMDVSSRATQARVAAVTAGTGVSNSLSSLDIVGKLLGGVAALGAGVVSAVRTPNGYSTLNAVIGIGLQEAPTATYSTVWQEQDLGEFLATGNISGIDIAKEYIRSNAGLKGTLGEVSGLSSAGAAQELASGKVRNPYKEQLFKQVEFRTFNFNFTFLPDSAGEAGNILEMFRVLRGAMLPARSKDGFYLVYPAQFTLTYMYKGSRNPDVPGIGTCVLTDMSTKYGGNDFVTFAGTAGKPAEMTLSMKFKEIIPITADQALGENL